ncbi:helix-turn-helix domain-containing protein [Couchioplanes azureus]|nr:helix-turn-helix domain-containing protein [Couchioplanes caeruleus]
MPITRRAVTVRSTQHLTAASYPDLGASVEETHLRLPRASVRPAEAAELLGVCRDTIYVLMRAGRLRSVRAGRARLIPLASIEEMLSTEEEFAL